MSKYGIFSCFFCTLFHWIKELLFWLFYLHEIMWMKCSRSGVCCNINYCVFQVLYHIKRLYGSFCDCFFVQWKLSKIKRCFVIIKICTSSWFCDLFSSFLKYIVLDVNAVDTGYNVLLGDQKIWYVITKVRYKQYFQ